jgi:hypothetical protein
MAGNFSRIGAEPEVAAMPSGLHSEERGAAQIKAGTARFARLVFGHDGAEDLRRAQFLLAEVPLAVVGQHLRRREPPPHIVDALIRITFQAVVEERRNVETEAGGA